MVTLIAIPTGALAAVAATLALAAGVLGLLVVRLRRERGEFHRILAGNYESCVRGLKSIIDARRGAVERIAQILKDAPDPDHAQVKMITERMAKAQQEINDAIVQRLEGDDRLSLDFEVYQRELCAGDETVAKLAEALASSVGIKMHHELRDQLEACGQEMETERSRMTERMEALLAEKSDLEARLEAMVPSDAADETERLLEQVRADLDAIEEELLDGEGGLRRYFTDASIEQIGKQIAKIDDEGFARTEGGAPDGHLQLQRIRRGILTQCLDRIEMERNSAELESRVRELEDGAPANAEPLEEIQQIEATGEQFRKDVGISREKIQAMADRIRELEAMEETSHRVKEELRSIGIINTELKEQVDRLEESQVHYEKTLLKLSKASAEIQQRDDQIAQMTEQIRETEREIEVLKKVIEKHEAAKIDGTAPSEGTAPSGPKGLGVMEAREALSDEKVEKVIAGDDVVEMRDTLRTKQEETKSLRVHMKTLTQEVVDKEMSVTRLESELDVLSDEYQKLFSKMPVQ